ncbi:dethiobiotin synthase [Alteromonas sp. a30]|uniref:dethiobiotin synthase n=1 Tax=Alteromonas sp. a30 TaxID=2730917 RepID=UPI00227E19C8|nr:dethiobiotin synthase [Alteromonas sp. a30]MCY7294000.1 dethiobiotin synthase [Alteromonas sp. a30]
MSAFFVTGTDTEVGKTYVSSLLLKMASEQGLRSAGFKPIASGCQQTAKGLENEDALALQKASSIPLNYSEVNPFSFEPAIAPHIAAKQMQVTLSFEAIYQAYLTLKSKQADLLIVEGAGGWRLPLGDGHFLSEFVQHAQLPVILVVGMKLGCLNHAKLTEEAITRDGLQLAGWVANHIDPQMHNQADNLASLHDILDAPCLGVVPHGSVQNSIEATTNTLSLDSLSRFQKI